MKISVALCTYNGEKFIQEQIDSILNQSRKVDEIVVCDDGSTDKTIEILNNYSKKNPNLFKIYRNEINLRSVKNFEKAISICSGDIIFLSDQDDIWIENKVEEYIKYFNENPTIDVLASNGFCIDENGVVHDKYAIWDVPQFLKDEKVEFDYFELITTVENFVTGATMAFRKKIVPEILPFPIIKNFHHDEWIAIIATNKNAFELLPVKYFKYRVHENQQVGGVFYDKSEKIKKYLTSYGNYQNSDLSFTLLKKRLKKVAGFYNLSNELSSSMTFNAKSFSEKRKKVLDFYNETLYNMNKKYPIKTILLKIVDRILKKRKINL